MRAVERAFGIAILLWCAAAAGAAVDRIAIVKKFREARDKGDLAAARAFLAPGARIWFDMEERTGPGQLWTLEPDDWDRWDRFFHSKTECSDWKDLGDRVTALGHETNDFYRLTEWKPRPLAFTWWFDSNGKITGFMFHPVKGGPPKRSRFEEFRAWAQANRPEELSYLMRKGLMDPSGDRPARWRDILIAWRKAAGLPEIRVP